MRRDGFEYYRWQAERCRELAARQPNADVQSRLAGVAMQYDELAEEVATDRTDKATR